MQKLLHTYRLSVLVAGVAISSGGMLHADEQPVPATPMPGVEVKGSETLSWDSNPLMLANGAKSLFGSTTSPVLILHGDTPVVHFSSDSLVSENIFNLSDFNSTDFHENLKLNKQLQEWGAAIQGKFDYDTTRTSEITTYNLNLPYVRHTGFSVAPDISYNFTTIDKLILAGSFARSTYNNAFVDYDIFALNPSYEHNFDPMSKGVFTLQAQRYQTIGAEQSKVDSIGPTIGWVSILTPRLTAKADAGVQKSMQNATATSPSSSAWNYIFDADLSFKGQQDTADLLASRSQYPFGNGTETLLTAFSLSDVHALNPSIALNFSGNYQFAKQPPGATGVNLDAEFGGIAGLIYHAFEHWDMTAHYQYKNETLTGISGMIQDHTILLGLTYHPFASLER